MAIFIKENCYLLLPLFILVLGMKKEEVGGLW